ncbi:TIGR00159 family protein [Candidatus Berkelbacteria bacterium]|nr:TIGR00159 family protein [Candidatus Berkelbacteria bacterium]
MDSSRGGVLETIATFALFNWNSLVDILIVATIFYGLYLLIRQTRAERILYGIVILGLFYFIAQYLNLIVLNFLLRSLVTVALVAIPIVFQPELRSALERLGRGELVPGFLGQSKEAVSNIVTTLAQATLRLSQNKIGALIVVERQTGIKDFADSGVQLNAAISQELLLSIFSPKTPLHDGAVIIRGNKIVAASAFLPLDNETIDRSLGTRHRAALGVTKDTDAVVIVVSEETGGISIIHRGKVSRPDRDQVERRLLQLILPRTMK